MSNPSSCGLVARMANGSGRPAVLLAARAGEGRPTAHGLGSVVRICWHVDVNAVLSGAFLGSGASCFHAVRLANQSLMTRPGLVASVVKKVLSMLLREKAAEVVHTQHVLRAQRRTVHPLSEGELLVQKLVGTEDA